MSEEKIITKTLSENRAKAVYDYLVSHNISSDRRYHIKVMEILNQLTQTTLTRAEPTTEEQNLR